jgi:uncharacterized MAPEG superfamily protein
MTTELNLLAASVVLGAFQLVAAAGLANGVQRGLAWGMGSRDEPKPPLTGMAGRLDRAFRNFLETFPFFAAAVLVAHTAGRHNALTFWGAELYFWGRVAYVPIYASGVFFIRSLVWGVALVGILLILAGLVS